MVLVKCQSKRSYLLGQFIEEYLTKSQNIKMVFLLIDIRHDIGENDKLMYDFLISRNIPFMVICTKADKLAPTKVMPQVEHLQQMLNPLKDISFLPYSTETKIYKDKILSIL